MTRRKWEDVVRESDAGKLNLAGAERLIEEGKGEREELGQALVLEEEGGD